MKKIRLIDSQEIEVYDISENGNMLTIQILNGNATELENVFVILENLAVIQYYVGTDLIRGYANYQKLVSYQKQKNITINTDYTKTDATTESGFAEEKADILTIVLEKKRGIELMRDGQQLQDEAIIDLASMIGG